MGERIVTAVIVIVPTGPDRYVVTVAYDGRRFRVKGSGSIERATELAERFVAFLERERALNEAAENARIEL